MTQAKKTTKVWLWVLIAVLVVAGVAAALLLNKPAAPVAAPKTLTYAISGDPEQLDPTLNSYSRSSNVLKQLFAGLYKVGPDGSTMLPALAEKVDVSADGLSYTFTLKTGLKWSDGSELTAADFEYSWKRVLNPEVASKAVADMFVLKNGKEYNEGTAKAEDVGVKAVDAKTLQVDLAYNAPWFLSLTANTSMLPVKQSVVEAGTADAPWTQNIANYVGNGPFMLKDYKMKERLSLVKNPNYVDAASVKLDGLEIVIIEAAEAELVAYENNEIDMADNLNAEAIAKFKTAPDYGVIYRIGIQYCDFNCERPPFDNKLVRQAFAMAVDRQSIVEKVLMTADQPLYGWVPSRQKSLTDPSKSYREMAGDMFSFDPAKAKELLAEAGYADPSTLPEIELVVQATQTQKDLAQGLQAMWQQNLGVAVKITTYESNAYWGELDKGNFSIDRNGWTGDYQDPLANLIIFQTGSNGYENRWDNAAYDALIDQIKAETDAAKREALMILAEKMLADEMPVMPNYGYSDDYLAKPYVSGVVKNALGHVLFEYVDINK